MHDADHLVLVGLQQYRDAPASNGPRIVKRAFRFCPVPAMDCAWWRFTVDLGRQPVDGVIATPLSLRLQTRLSRVRGAAAQRPTDTHGERALLLTILAGCNHRSNGDDRVPLPPRPSVRGQWLARHRYLVPDRHGGDGRQPALRRRVRGLLRPQGHRFLSRPEPAQPRLPGTSAEAVPIVLYDPTTDFTDPNGERIVDDVVAELRDISQVSAVASPVDRPDLVSDDGHTAIVSLTVNERFAADTAIGEEILASAQAAAGPDVQVALGGFIGAQISQPRPT